MSEEILTELFNVESVTALKDAVRKMDLQKIHMTKFALQISVGVLEAELERRGLGDMDTAVLP